MGRIATATGELVAATGVVYNTQPETAITATPTTSVTGNVNVHN